MILLKIGKIGRIMRLLFEKTMKTIYSGLRTINKKTIINKKIDIDIDSLTKENITVHQINLLNENRITSNYSNTVRRKIENAVFFTNSILTTFRMGELNCYVIVGGTILNNFLGSKVSQLNQHTVPIHDQK